MTELEEMCNKHNIRIVSEYGGVPSNPNFGPGHHSYKVTLSRRNPRRKITVPFYMGSGHSEAPTAADVLYCLILDGSYYSYSFEDWCNELGYDTDSIKAKKVYDKCNVQGLKVRKFLEDNFDDFAAAEH